MCFVCTICLVSKTSQIVELVLRYKNQDIDLLAFKQKETVWILKCSAANSMVHAYECYVV